MLAATSASGPPELVIEPVVMKTLVLCVLLCFALHYKPVSSKQRWHKKPIELSDLIKGLNFVDKTLLIKTIFENPAKIMITAPSYSGKSTNLYMMKTFLEVEVDEYGYPLTKLKDFRKPVDDTNNYNLFNNNKLKITRNEKFMRRHFGKYPVLLADFMCRENKITNSENALYCFIETIHEAFFKHRYLIKSDVLTTKERRYVKKWCDSYVAYERFYGQDVTNSLYKLAILLYKHFGKRKIVILLDNYDFPSTSAMYSVQDGKELNRVIKFNMGIIAKLLSADYRYIKRAVVTGVSYLTAAGIYRLDGVQVYRYLDNHPFNQYFGLTRPEVDHLFKRVFNKSSILPLAHSAYGGFATKDGKEIYNLNPIMKLLQSSEVKNYCSESGLLHNLSRLFKISSIHEQVETLIKCGTIKMNMSDVITVNDIINLRDAVLNVRNQEHFNVNLIYYFLLEQGYLSYVYRHVNCSKVNEEVELKIPNYKTRTTFALKLKEYYDRMYDIDRTLVKKCSSFFENYSPSLITSSNHLKRALYWFYKSFEDLVAFTKKGFNKLSMFDIHRLLFSVAYQISSKGDNSFTLQVGGENGELDVHLIKANFYFLLKLRPNYTSDQVLRHVLNLHLTSIYNQPHNAKTILIGVGIDEELRPSVSCLPNSRNITEAIHIPDIFYLS